MADAPPDLIETYECRNRAIECLAAIDRPALWDVWKLGYGQLIEDIVVGMRQIDALAGYAATLAGVEPKALPLGGDRPKEKTPPPQA